MGEVRDGHDMRLDRPVAIKLLRSGLAQDPDAREAFEREAQAAAKLSHPRVVAIYDTGESNGVPYIVMERLPGRTLADEIERGPLSERTVRRLALQVLAALQAAHDAGIVHRDVKPSNILLTVAGDAKVADFGIAKSVDDDQSTGIVLGTATYVAPERIDGTKASPASDLYSLGVVLYEALSGTKPFVATNPVALLHAAQEGDAPPLGDDVEPRLRETIERAMAPDPSDRFASARDMAASLEAAKHEVTEKIDRPGSTARLPTAALPTPPPRSSKPRQRTRMLESLSPRATAFLVLTALLIVVAVLALTTGGGDANLGGAVTPTTTPASVAKNQVPLSLPPPVANAFSELEKAVGR